jgi:hypothetical protein
MHDVGRARAVWKDKCDGAHAHVIKTQYLRWKGLNAR